MLGPIIAIPLALAAILAGLVAFSRPPGEKAEASEAISFAEAVSADYADLPKRRSYVARDGTSLEYRSYGDTSGSRRLVLLVHGSAWHGMQFHPMAKTLADRGLGVIVAPDLRGHGHSPERRGDVDYIGQLEDDLADLVDHLGSRDAFDEIVLAGHSSGGGLAVRLAGGPHGDKVDRFVLMAPFLKYNAPTTRPDSGGWASPATARIIGLSIVNSFGITAFNHLPVISFAMPAAVLDGPYGDTATTQYSFRLNQSFAPRSDYRADLRAMTVPFLVIAGSEDEAFRADLYEEVISAETSAGDYVVLPGVGHIGVTTDLAAFEAIAGWIAED